MKFYVSDAIAFLHYMLDDLPQSANNAFREAESGKATIYLPTIAAAELFYLFKKKQRRRLWSKFKEEMNAGEEDQEGTESNFQYYAFDKAVLQMFEKTRAKEIHDKIIVSTAKITKCDALITKDGEIADLQEVKTLWA